MAVPDNAVAKPKQQPTSESVTTRVNVAFPFSQIKVQEPSEDLAELAAVVRELADLVADVVPGSSARKLSKRARLLSARLAER
jgi:hypothetical protein